MTKHDFRFTPQDHERMKEALDNLSDIPTEEEAEAVLQACGTSGKEVVNEFIERLLKENLELKQELARRAAVAGPREDALFAELLAAFDSTRMGDKGINQGCWCVQSPTDTNQPDWKHEKHCKRNMALLKRCEAAATADNDADCTCDDLTEVQQAQGDHYDDCPRATKGDR